MSLLTDILSIGISSKLKDNSFAYALFTTLVGGKEIKKANELSAIAQIEEKRLPASPYVPTVGESMDVRARKILIKGIRRFPADNDVYYCLDFCNGAEARSSVFLGSNGVGKSSVYVALEKVYLQRLYSSYARGVSEDVDEEIRYLRNLNTTESEGRIILDVSNRLDSYVVKIADSPKSKALSYPCFFCMEWDVETLAKSATSDYIADQLKIADFLTILKLFDEIVREYYEEIENPAYNDRLAELSRLEKELADTSVEDITRRHEIEKNRQAVEGEIHKHETRFPAVLISPVGIDNLIKTKNFLQEEYGMMMTKLLRNAEVVFPRLFEKYRKEDILNVALSVGNDDRSLNIQLAVTDPKKRNNRILVAPQLYLNTFRFKLFCVALKVSLAFCCKSLYKINAPIVIDDVFDSSDFQNRERIRDFIHDLYSAHEDLFGKTSPLQLIFFTQDDIIGDSVFHGILDYGPIEGAKYSRIFNYLEADPETDMIHYHLNALNSGDQEDLKAYRIEDVIKDYR